MDKKLVDTLFLKALMQAFAEEQEEKLTTVLQQSGLTASVHIEIDVLDIDWEKIKNFGEDIKNS
jgi:hypothetical protein